MSDPKISAKGRESGGVKGIGSGSDMAGNNTNYFEEWKRCRDMLINLITF